MAFKEIFEKYSTNVEVKETKFQPNSEDLKKLGWGELIDENDWSKGKYYPLHKYQQEFYNFNTRFNAAIAGTGGGKTVCGSLRCLKHIQTAIERYGKCLGFIAAPTYKVLERATAPTFIDAINYTVLGIQAGGKHIPSRSQYILPNNWGKIWLQGADNPGGLEGGQFDFAWLDEGGQVDKKVFRALEGRTGAKRAPFDITTTPYLTNDGFGPLHKEWFKNWKENDPDYSIVTFPSIANPVYPQEEYERAKKILPPEVFKSRYCGLFTSVEGLVYPQFYKCKVTASTKEIKKLLKLAVTQPSNTSLHGGIDFGWNDPFCALAGIKLGFEYEFCGNVYPADTLYLFYERYRSKRTIEEHSRFLPKIPNRKIRWAADHDPQSIMKLKKASHTVVPAKKRIRGKTASGIRNRIILVNSRILTNKLVIIENRCPALCTESEMYAYPEKDEEIIGEVPIDKFNHAMDAMGYMIADIDYKKGAENIAA